jgi:hypothetical protein
MPKTLVTHIHPDLDAIFSLWLFVRFDQSRYGDAKLAYVAQGSTYKNEPVDSDDDVIHADTGRGVFDHHQPGVLNTCAGKLVYDHLLLGGHIDEDDIPVREMVDFVLEIDNFQDLYWPDTDNPRYAFMIHEIVPALHSLQIYDDEAVTRMTFTYLDATYQKLKERMNGKEIIEDGIQFDSVWGKGIAISGEVDDLSKLGQRMGYHIVVIYNPKKQYMKVKTAPRVPLALKPLYDKIIELESPDMWFYHNSGHIMLTGSDKGGPKAPTTLTLDRMIEIIQNIKI